MGKKRDLKQVEIEMNELGYTLPNGLKSFGDKVYFKDSEGYSYFTTIMSTLNGGIPSRFHINNRYTIENIKLYLKLTESKFELLSKKYNGSGHDMQWKNKDCGHTVDCCWDTIKQDLHGCSICSNQKVLIGYNDINTTDPHLSKYFKDKRDTYKYARKSNKEVWMVCPDCNTDKKIKISILTTYGFSCPKCSDGRSVPNKFLINILSQLKSRNEDFEFSVEKPISEKRYVYDAVVNHKDKTYTIEAHGGQHYYEASKFKSRTLAEEKKNDIEKKKHSESIGNTHIEVDCRDSSFDFLKSSFEKEMVKYFNVDEILWRDAYTSSLKSLVLEASRLYNEYSYTTKDISKTLSIAICTASRYLKICNELGLCDYNPKNSVRKKFKNIYMYSNTKEFLKKYNNVKEVCEDLKVKRSTVYSWCRGEKNCSKGYIFSYKKIH